MTKAGRLRAETGRFSPHSRVLRPQPAATTKTVPPAPSWIKKVQGVLRGPPCPFVDQKGSRCSPRPSVPLRGPKRFKVFSAALRAPSWTKKVQGVLRDPPCPFVDQKGSRCSPRPSAPLRGPKRSKVFSWPFVDQKGLRCSSRPSPPPRPSPPSPFLPPHNRLPVGSLKTKN